MNHLLLACLNLEMGDQIGRTIGRVINCMVQNLGAANSRILRLCVELDLFKSIPHGRIINIKGERLWIPFTYEKLPCLCFKCKKILHGDEGCE